MGKQIGQLSPGMEILVVEDSYTQAMKLKQILEESSYVVSVTHNGQEALSHIKKKKPDVVISDVMMPEVNGYELCERIKDDDKLKDIPVILLTSLSEPSDIIKGLKCGADHFITKPYDKDYLLSHIHYILVNRELRKSSVTDMGVEIFFGGQKYYITSDRLQIIDLLFSTYEVVAHKNKELERVNKRLKKSLETIKTLEGLVPICSRCKKIRNDKGFWQHLEVYLTAHSNVEFTHGICPDCERKLYSEKEELK